MRAHLSTAKEVWLENMLPCQEKEPHVTKCLASHSLKALHQNSEILYRQLHDDFSFVTFRSTKVQSATQSEGNIQRLHRHCDRHPA